MTVLEMPPSRVSRPGTPGGLSVGNIRLQLTAGVLLAALSLAGTVSAQDGALARADSLRMAGDLVGALQSYQAAYRSNPGDAATAYAFASTFALQAQFPDSAFYYLDVALRQDSSMQVLFDADMYFLLQDERWQSVEDRQLDKLAEQVRDSFDREYARKLFRMRIVEWAYRYHITLAFRELGPNSPILTALANAMQEHHAQDLVNLEDLLKEKGWPRLSSVGEQAAYAAGNVVNHSDLDVRQKYLPLLKNACEQSEADWSRYAPILDRTELELGHPQVYGTQMELNEDTGLYEPQPLLDPGSVDQRRAELGMEPIAEQLKRFNESMQRDFGTSGGS